jgi:phage repressor protein C with HTH and peptisase S24 domain
MGWADLAIKELRAGKETVIFPTGSSMEPKINSGDKVILCPIANSDFLYKDDIVLVAINNQVFLHLITATDPTRVQISNNKGNVNGWAPRTAIYGKVIYIKNA